MLFDMDNATKTVEDFLAMWHEGKEVFPDPKTIEHLIIKTINDLGFGIRDRGPAKAICADVWFEGCQNHPPTWIKIWVEGTRYKWIGCGMAALLTLFTMSIARNKKNLTTAEIFEDLHHTKKIIAKS